MDERVALRQYLAVIQDARGYPPPGAPLDKAPPDGPEQPMVYAVVKAEEHEAEVARLRESLRLACTDAFADGDAAMARYLNATQATPDQPGRRASE